jgi:hypothetical protein
MGAPPHVLLAYIDPMSGSILLQLMIAAVIGLTMRCSAVLRPLAFLKRLSRPLRPDCYAAHDMGRKTDLSVDDVRHARDATP